MRKLFILDDGTETVVWAMDRSYCLESLSEDKLLQMRHQLRKARNDKLSNFACPPRMFLQAIAIRERKVLCMRAFLALSRGSFLVFPPELKMWED